MKWFRGQLQILAYIIEGAPHRDLERECNYWCSVFTFLSLPLWWLSNLGRNQNEQ